MPTENFANFYSSLLDGSINNSTTSVVVDSVTGAPTAPQFRAVIQDGENDETNREIVIVTAVSSLTFTVTRGAEGTSAVSHGDNSYIAAVLTAGAMNVHARAGTDVSAVTMDKGAYALLSRRASANTEDDHFDAGSLDGKWTHLNVGGSVSPTFTLPGWVFLAKDQAIQQAVPAGDYSIECEFIGGDWTSPAFQKPGLYFSNSSTITGAQRHFFVGTNNAVSSAQTATLQNHTNGVSVSNIFSGSVGVSAVHGHWFLKATKASTTYTFFVSDTGKAWYQVGSTSSLGITPTHFGICCLNASAAGAYFNYFLRY